MSQTIWQDAPTIPLLQWLVRGSLQQHLPQAVRLWVWLHLLYGAPAVRLSLPEPFTYADWRDAFFRDGHPTGEAKPLLHSPQCPCAKTIAAWLFAPSLTDTQPAWEGYQANPIHTPVLQGAMAQRHSARSIAQFKQELAQHHALPKNIETILHRQRLFGVTRRTLANDLQILTEIHWLRRVDKAFHRVDEWPNRPMVTPPETAMPNLIARDLAFLTQPDLAAIADSLSNDIQGERRFFVHVDYVVARPWIDQVDEWQAQLRLIWQQSPIPPLKVCYQRAGATEAETLVLYPVCIYYYRRGPYLCGYGQISGKGGDELGWRNYRLDRIQAIDPLGWDNPLVPSSLYEVFWTKTLPSPETIQTRMAEAWGFDYYQPAQTLLLRFDQGWNRKYIRNSLRHETFQSIEYGAIAPLIQTELTGKEQKAALKLWRSRSSEDAYYQAVYRRDDSNVHQRLRAWRPHVEVLLPWALRQQMLREIQQEAAFYVIGDDE
ncbi:MAG: TIGR03985 family CRISPR-associated protein [Cyanothece sp. SIO2G6]|nr:TIGR03985 family CRISPR-associated protein [Cyanothece sp. SIO2G6]